VQLFFVMAGLVPGHPRLCDPAGEDGDARHKAGRESVTDVSVYFAGAPGAFSS